jgi:hypothetical protein
MVQQPKVLTKNQKGNNTNTQSSILHGLETPFKLANITAMSGWLVLMVLPEWVHTQNYVLYVAFLLLAAIYIFLLQKAMREKPDPGSAKPSFTKLSGVLALLQQPAGALAAWIHILAFDLMMGLYIHNEGAAAGMSHWLLLPCYVLTLMLGPIGVLLFLGLKFFMVGI